MKSLLTVSGVVFAHICVFLLLVNGCRGTSGSDDWRTGDTSIYSGGARSSSVPAVAEPVAAEPAVAVPEDEEPPAAVPAAQTSAAETQREAVPAEKDIYKVKKGDTLSMIAVRNGITAKELADANGIKLNSTLRIGQTLKIPAAKPKAKTAAEAPVAEGEVYIVQRGDTLGEIALKNKTTVAKLKSANNLKNDVIFVGQKLVIPSKTEKKSADQPKTEPEPEKKTLSEETVPAAVPEKEAASGESESVIVDENLGMPEGGFELLEDLSVAAPEESVPAEAVPATDESAE